MKKKVLSLVLAAAMVFTMAACGNEGTRESGSQGTEGSSQGTEQSGSDGQDQENPQTASHKVTFYDAD